MILSARGSRWSIVNRGPPRRDLYRPRFQITTARLVFQKEQLINFVLSGFTAINYFDPPFSVSTAFYPGPNGFPILFKVSCIALRRRNGKCI